MRADVKTAVHLLGWLREHGTTLATCRQSDIDEWAADQTWRHDHARSFLTWAVRNRHAAHGRLESRPKQLLAVSIEADHRWTLVRRLLHDEALDPVDRLAGLLVLLFAQPLARIARLTVDQVVDDEGHAALQLGAKPVRLPRPSTISSSRCASAATAMPSLAGLTNTGGCSPVAGRAGH